MTPKQAPKPPVPTPEAPKVAHEAKCGGCATKLMTVHLPADLAEDKVARILARKGGECPHCKPPRMRRKVR